MSCLFPSLMLPVIISASLLTFICVNPYSDFDAISTPPCASPSLSRLITSNPSSAEKISPFPVSFVNQVSVPMMTSGWAVSSKTGSSVRLFVMLWKLIIKVLEVFLFFGLLWCFWLFGLVMMWLKGLHCKSRCRQYRQLTLCSEHLSMMTLYSEHLS